MTPAPFSAADVASKFEIKANNNLVFKHSSSDFLMDIFKSKELKRVLEEIAAYLQSKNDRKLVLTGYNHPDEVFESALANLGMVRANRIRSLLMNLGANGQQIEIKGKEDGRLAVVESALYGKFLPNAMGFDFESFTRRDARKLRREKRRIEANLKKIQVFRFTNFGKTKHKIIIDDKTKTYLNDLILYISINEKAQIYCVGHSNALKSKEKSFEMGANRANFARDFLLSHGIMPSRIITKSAGATHPLGEETTQYGQQINRRGDVFISYYGNEPKVYALPPITAD